ncbi:hypothetical protein ACQKWADRAFT_284134 [Trichoderma austrokoningii]
MGRRVIHPFSSRFTAAAARNSLAQVVPQLAGVPFCHLPDREQSHDDSSSKSPDPPRQTRRPMPGEPSGPEAFPLPTWRLLASAWPAAIRDLARNAMWSDLA